MLMAEKDHPRKIRVSFGLELHQALLLNLSVMIALAIFLFLGSLLSFTGSQTPLLFVLLGLLVILNLLGYTELSLSTPATAGAYSVIHDFQQGGWLAFSTGWTLILAGLFTSALLAKGFAIQASALFEEFGG